MLFGQKTKSRCKKQAMSTSIEGDTELNKHTSSRTLIDTFAAVWVVWLLLVGEKNDFQNGRFA